MAKYGDYPADTNPTGDDLILTVDMGSGATKKVTISSLGVLFASLTGAQVLTNTAVQVRIASTTTASAPTPNVDTTDLYILTALNSNLTLGAPTGTPTEGQSLLVRIKADSSAHTLSYNAMFRGIGVTLPTSISASQLIYLKFFYNNAETKWDCLSVARS